MNAFRVWKTSSHPPKTAEAAPAPAPVLEMPGLVTLYRVHVGRRIYGPIPAQQLRKVPGFTLQTPVAPYGTDYWRPAWQAIDLQKYFCYAADNSYTREAHAQTLRDHISDIKPQIKKRAPQKRVSGVRRSRLALFMGFLAVSGTLIALKPSLPSLPDHKKLPSLQTLRLKTNLPQWKTQASARVFQAFERLMSFLEP